jgi:hypothetical protein
VAEEAASACDGRPASGVGEAVIVHEGSIGALCNRRLKPVA